VTAAVGLAGCLGGGGEETDDGNGGDSDGDGSGAPTVAVGPDGRFVFEPAEVTVSTGETVTWTFESAGHNVYAYEGGPQVELPDGAEGFGSVPEDDQYAVNDSGATFEHTFETTGTFQYSCVPHAGSGMVGTVVVEE
jgi:plastocyanin